MSDYHEVAAFAHALLRALEPFGWDEVFVTYCDGWERATMKWRYVSTEDYCNRAIKVCWLATPIA